MKIAVIGPIHPFVGGISHYNTELCKSLSTNHELVVISYKRRYPMFLYPGKNQIDKKCSRKSEISNVEYILDTVNPITWIKAVSRIKKENPNLLIFHWVTPFMTPMFVTVFFLLKKLTRIQILAICHNVLPHERTSLDVFLTKLVFRNVDYFIVHSRKDFTNLKKIVTRPTRRVLFPLYHMFKVSNISKNHAKEIINLTKNDKVILFFGYIREYKGLIYLIQAMPKVLIRIPTAKLLVVGEFWDNKERYLAEIENLNIKNAVILIDKYVHNDQVELYFSAADVVVLPYISATQSAVVQTAYYFNKPVITTRVGGLPDIVTDKKTGLIVEPKDSEMLAEAISEYLEQTIGKKMGRIIHRTKWKFSWERLVKTIEKLGENNESRDDYS
ncbi:glycosyltransferase family 4 protein [Thermococcus barossii]|uniref:Glycosyl transferase family 1 n=1 Tax=Thermococcus barossii TaxID=54077 RepID=A0A2Z2MTV6_9EURY|nr:glycosyltransferase family 4 protein [Thermococcus barossii]ASJ05721.1 glycosyl transferase family 1 [Thermococcus barossii]